MLNFLNKWLDKVAVNYVKKRFDILGKDVKWRSLTASKLPTQVTNPYEVSAWVYGAVSVIARNLSRIPIKLSRKRKLSEDFISYFDFEPIKSGQLYEVFTRPNLLTTWRQHVMTTVTSLELYGESFWLLDRDNVSEFPREMWVVNPVNFQPIFDKDNKNLIGWKYKKGSIEIDFNLYEVIFFKYPNPYDELRGLAPASAASLGISQDYYASEFNKNFFEEGVAVSGIIEVEDELSPEAYSRLLSAFEERHRGYKKSHKVVLIEGGGKFTPYTPSYREFEFTSLRKLNKEEILTAFGVNPVIIGDYKDIKCYHPETFVLTENGFDYISNINVGQKVATLNFETKQVEYHPVTKIFKYDYKGYLYRPSNAHFAYGVDFLVTPEHKVVVMDAEDNLHLKEIESLNSNFRYVKFGDFNNNNVNSISITDDKGKTYGYSFKSFLSLLAWYFAEGSVTKEGYIKFNIKTPNGRTKFRYYTQQFSDYIEQVSQLGFVLMDKNTCNTLFKYIDTDKKISRKLVNLNPECLEHFIKTLVQTEEFDNENSVFKTNISDINIANSLIELCLKCKIHAFYTKIGKDNAFYRIKIKATYNNDFYCDGFDKIPYEGAVYCLEVPPNHNICILFNGKYSWSGNSYEGINAAHRAFWVENIVPKAEMISDIINYQFMRYLKDGSYLFSFDFNSIEALREDFYRKVDTAERLYQIGFPINMINKRLDLGMEEVEWGDIWWVDQRRVPVDAYMEQWENYTETPNTDKNDNDNDSNKSLTPELYFLIKKLDGKLRKFFFDQRKSVLNKIETLASDYKKFPFLSLIDINSEKEKLQTMLQNALREAYPTIPTQIIEKRTTIIINSMLPDIKRTIDNILNKSNNKQVMMSKIKQFYDFVLRKCLDVSKTEAEYLHNFIKTNKINKEVTLDEDSE